MQNLPKRAYLAEEIRNRFENVGGVLRMPGFSAVEFLALTGSVTLPFAPKTPTGPNGAVFRGVPEGTAREALCSGKSRGGERGIELGSDSRG